MEAILKNADIPQGLVDLFDFVKTVKDTKNHNHVIEFVRTGQSRSAISIAK